MIARTRVLALGLALSACTYQGTPVPVAGDTQLLAGDWEGTYESDQTGRSGTIAFSLKAGTDSAFGDVWMMPRRPDYPQYPSGEPGGPGGPRVLPRPLRISFVQCSEGDVTGNLDPYEDPETQERVFTTFEGRLQGDRLKGRFYSLYQPSGVRATGTWTMTRKPPKPPSD
jgi:hypothetical protein